MAVRLAERMSRLAPYLFADLDKKKEAALAQGVDVISLTIGDPDLPTPDEVVDAGRAALRDPANHRYPAYAGSRAFRQAAAAWMRRRFDVALDANDQVLALIGTKEGIGHMSWALLDPGDVALCPDPGYPVYAISARLAGAEVFQLPLLAGNGFLPDLDAIPPEACRRAKVLWINYPNNPTGATAGLDFLHKAVAFARKHEVLLCADCAYSEIAFDGYRAPSVLQVPGALDVAVEFHSMSKSYNMTGWRIGFAAGQTEAIQALGNLKNNLDSGAFTAVQVAAMRAMELWPEPCLAMSEVYRKRRDVLVDGLNQAGYRVDKPQGGFFVWMRVPDGDDQAFAARLIERAGVLVAPGSGFGQAGSGYVRFALTVTEKRLGEAVERIRQMG